MSPKPNVFEHEKSHTGTNADYLQQILNQEDLSKDSKNVSVTRTLFVTDLTLLHAVVCSYSTFLKSVPLMSLVSIPLFI